MFHYHSEYFPFAENQELRFCSTAFADKRIGENMVCRLFYQLVVNMGKYLPQREKVRENTSCLTALVIFAKLSLFSANISPYQPQAHEINSIYFSYTLGKGLQCVSLLL